VAAKEVLSPASPHPHVLVAFNAPSLAKFGPTVRSGGTIVYDSSVIAEMPDGLAPGVRTAGVPFTAVAKDLGNVLVKNVVALGALQATTELFPEDTFLTAIRGALNGRSALRPLNEDAFAWGVKLAREQMA
jgi:Pyruvate/2-oxoacid:ferredoxin oxidoreductase gamma subunit